MKKTIILPLLLLCKVSAYAKDLSTEELKIFNEKANLSMTYSDDAWNNQRESFIPEEIEKQRIGNCVAYVALKAHLLVQKYHLNPQKLTVLHLKGKRNIEALWDSQMWNQHVKAYDNIASHMTLMYKGKILDYKFYDSLDIYFDSMKKVEKIDYKVVQKTTWDEEEKRMRKMAKMNALHKSQ